MLKENFWEDVSHANTVTQELSNLKREVTSSQELTQKINDLKEMFSLINDDESLKIELANDTPANSAVPRCPTIMLSARLTVIWPA